MNIVISYDKLFARLKDKGITRSDLENIYGIDPKIIDKLENNEDMEIRIFVKFCKILDCTLEDIITYTPEE